MTFEIGDVVTLKSGGPSMTIDGVMENGVRCIWFNGGGGVMTGTFSLGVLEVRKSEKNVSKSEKSKK